LRKIFGAEFGYLRLNIAVGPTAEVLEVLYNHTGRGRKVVDSGGLENR
jgi:hypothetical protein